MNENERFQRYFCFITVRFRSNAPAGPITQDITYNNAKSAYTGTTDDAQRRRSAWLDGIRGHIATHPGGGLMNLKDI